MKYLKLTLSFTIVMIGVILGLHFRDDCYVAFIFTMQGLKFALPVALVLGLIAIGFRLAKRRLWQPLSWGLVISCSCVVALVFFTGTGVMINRWKVNAVLNYVARAVPILDRIKQKTGAYPSELPVDLVGKPPELLRNYGRYSASGNTFSFEYDDIPVEWAGGDGPVWFTSEMREWKHEED